MPPKVGRGQAIRVVAVLVLLLFQGGGRVSAQGIEGERVLLPLVGNRLCGGRVAPTLFGVQMYTTTGETSPYFADLIDSGATWVRVPVPWRNAQAALSDPPVYRWEAADKALAGVDDGCFNIIGTHSLAPSWAADIPNGPVHEEYLDDLADYLGALAERYDGDGDQDAPGSPVVRYWELYNEPDAITTWTGWAGEPERYAAMLQLASSAIKQANPDAKVLFGGLGYDWWDDPVMPFDPDFIRNVVNAGGVDFDYMNFHSFPLSAPRWASQGPGLLQKTNAVRAEMASLGLDKPIIITETGHLALGNPPLDNDELQMRYVAQLYVHAKAAAVETLIWFTLNDLANYPSYMGLVTAADPPVRRPAYTAYGVAVQEMGAAQYVRQLSTAETGAYEMEAHLLDVPSRQQSIIVAWLNPVHTEKSKPLSLAADQVVVRDVYGHATIVTDVQDGVDDGNVTVSVGGRPVYLELEQ